jgi:glutamate racemase
LYSSVVERFANGVDLIQSTCPGLVAQIERGALDQPETRAILEEALQPMLAKNIDTIVLGCTHYPFVIPLIQEIAGGQVRVIDPAPAVARQVRRLLETRALQIRGSDPVEIKFFTTGPRQLLEALLPKLLGQPGRVQSLHWDESELKLVQTFIP